MLADLAVVSYRMRIEENRVIVGRHDGEADYGAEVLATFARFRRDSIPAPLEADVFRTINMNGVEIGILQRVARLHRPVFGALAAWADRHRAFLDPSVAAFAEDLGFYLGWLERIDVQVAELNAIVQQSPWMAFWALVVAGFLPIPLKIFTWASGIVGVPLLPFLASMVVGRGKRVYLLAGVVRLAGPRAEALLHRWIEWIGWGIVVLILLAVVYFKFLH